MAAARRPEQPVAPRREAQPGGDQPRPGATDAEMRQRRLRQRNWAMGAALAAFAALTYIVAMVRMGGG